MLSAGTRLGPYEILGLIGAGGMGEVYKARDSRLGRDVAIKILPSAFSSDTDRLRRFEQEARAAASLNHPNILALFDIGLANESLQGEQNASYIVSELLEGDSLRQRLQSAAAGSSRTPALASAAGASDTRTPASAVTGSGLPLRKAIDYATQIARGLAAAHEKGIVHRDLKPENVFVTSDGRVKILDFGLAKLTEKEPAPGSTSLLPTINPDTLPGVVLGTIGYMSPEQVRGRPADHRSDIFSFGAVLYEMLSGQRAFHRDTTADTMTAILKEDPPDLPTRERRIPPALARIVDRCVEKSPAARFQSASDLAFALDALSSDTHARTDTAHDAPVTASGVTSAGTRTRLPWILAAAFGAGCVALLALGAFLYVRRPADDVRTIRFGLTLPEGWNLALGLDTASVVPAPLAMSPDGRRVAFVARNVDSRVRIWVRSLDTLLAQELTGTDDGSAPFWSPDSRALGFFAGGKLKKIDIAGGPPLTLCDVGNNGSGAWSPAGVIVFGSFQSPLQRVSDKGGQPTAATSLSSGETAHTRPRFLPDGRHFLYRGIGVKPSVFVGALDSTDRVELLDVGSTNVLYAQGHLLYLRETTLMAQPFDPEKLTLTGEAFPVAEQLQTQTLGGVVSGVFSVSDAGVLAYQTGAAKGIPRLTWVDRAGTSGADIVEAASYGDVSLSPDGRFATVSLLDVGVQSSDLWTVDLTRGLRTRFTFDPADELSSIWSPDGSRIVFNSRRKGHFDLYEKAATGAGDEKLILADDLNKFPVSWSRDGQFILYMATGGETVNDLWVLPTTAGAKPRPFVQTRFGESFGQFSPDGRWVAYQSNDSGPIQVYVAPFPGPGGKWQVSSSGGTGPRWRPDGKEILFVAPDNKLTAVEITDRGTSLEVGAAKPLFTLQPGGPRSAYDVAPGGQRFLVNLAPPEPVVATPITVVVNWTAGLKK